MKYIQHSGSRLSLGIYRYLGQQLIVHSRLSVVLIWGRCGVKQPLSLAERHATLQSPS